MFNIKKRVISLFLSMCVISSVLTSLPVNAVENIADWNVRLGAEGEVTLDKEVYHSGNTSMKIVNLSDPAPNVYISVNTPINLEAGKTYEIGAYVKTKRATSLYMTVSWGTRYNLLPIGNTYDWTLYKVEYTADETATKELMFNTDNTSTIWLDDVFCIEKGTNNNLVKNSNFDTAVPQKNNSSQDMPLEGIFNNISDSEKFNEEDYLKVRGGFKYMPVYEGKNITIDGDISDWESYPPMSMPTLSTQYQDYIVDERIRDVSVISKFAYDDTYLYIMVDVTDDINLFKIGENAYWSGDSIQMAISTLDETYGSEIGFSYNAEKDDCEVYAPSYFAEALGFVQKKMRVKENGGATYEIAIPWTLKFDEKPDSFLFNILVNDNDGDGRRYCVELSPGISEGKSNLLFPKLQLLSESSEVYGWIQGVRNCLTTDELEYEYFIVNSGKTKNFTVNIENTSESYNVSIPKGTGIHKSFKTKFVNEGENQVVIKVISDDGEVTIGQKVSVSRPLPTAEDALKVKDNLIKQVDEINSLMEKCQKKGIPTDYELMNYRILELFITHIQEDIDNSSFERLEYTENALNGIYKETKENLLAYLDGSKEAKSVPKYVSGDITFDGQTIYANTDTNGIAENRPTFLIGYGHFIEKLSPVMPTFNDYAVNAIQGEAHLYDVIVKPVIFDKWIDRVAGTGLVGGFRCENGVVKSGNNSLAATMQSEKLANRYLSVYQDVDVTPGETYTLSGWVKADGLTDAYIATNDFSQRTAFDTGTYDWKKFSSTFTVPEDRSNTIIRIAIDGPVNNVYFDDISLIEKITGRDVLENGSFETKSPYEDYYVDITKFRTTNKLLKLAEESNISVDLGTGIHYFPQFLIDKYPEIKYNDVSFLKVNVNHPIVRDVIETYIKAFGENFKKFKAVHSICLTNEPYFKTQMLESFYIDEWQKYLEGVYNYDINLLNLAYNTDYTSFNEVSMAATTEDFAKNYDLKIFNDIKFSEFHKWLADTLREVAPGIPLHAKIMNFVGNGTSKSGNLNNGTGLAYYDFLDLNGNDSVNYVDQNRGVLTKEMWYDLQGSVKDKTIANTEDHVVPDRGTYYDPEIAFYVSQDIWQGAIRGRGISNIWSWFKSYSSTSDAAGSLLFRPDAMQKIGETTYDLNRLSYEITALEKEPREIGILYSDASALNDSYFMKNVYEAYSACSYNGKKVQFVVEEQIHKLNDCKMLIVPCVPYVKQTTLDAISKYIENGGTVVILDEASLNNNEHALPNDVQLVNYIKDNSIIFKNLKDADEEELFEFSQNMSEIFKKLNLCYVSVIDEAMGQNARDVEYSVGIYNGKMIINLDNFGAEKKVNIYVNGKKLASGKELRTLADVNESIELKQYSPIIIETDIENRFLDTYGHWAENYIIRLTNKSIISGISESRFAPDKSITRAEFLALILRAAKIEEKQYWNCIEDVKADSWYATTIQAAVNSGIIDTSCFRPDEPITREDMCDLTVKLIEYISGEMEQSESLSFNDESDINLKGQVKKAVCAGIMVGMPDGTFAPRKNSTRAEATVIVEKILNYFEMEE